MTPDSKLNLDCTAHIEQCKAACCYNVPIPKIKLQRLKSKFVTIPVRYSKFGEHMLLPFTNEDPNENKCPFLREDLSCNIYEQRPHICQIFGNASDRHLKCDFIKPQS